MVRPLDDVQERVGEGKGKGQDNREASTCFVPIVSHPFLSPGL